MTKAIYNACASKELESFTFYDQPAFVTYAELPLENGTKEIQEGDIAEYTNMEELASAKVEKIMGNFMKDGTICSVAVNYIGDETTYVYPDGNTYAEPEEAPAPPPIEEEEELAEGEIESGLYYSNGELKYDWQELKDNGFIVVENGVLKPGYKLTSTEYNNKDAFCDKLVIDEEVTEIGDSVIINHTSIGTFEDCKKLKEVIMPDSITKIGGDVFEGCSLLTNVKLSNNLTLISEFAFAGCSSLKEINIPNGIVSIGDRAFASSGLESVSLPDSVKRLNCYAFSCGNLKEVNLNNGLEYIDEGCFSGCVFEFIIIPDSVVSLGQGGGISGAFYACEELSYIKLSENLTSIPGNCFYYCKSLTSIEIPSNVTKIESSAFQSTGILEIVIPDKVTIIESNAFYYSELKQVTIGQSVETIEYGAFTTTCLENIFVDDENPYCCDIDGILFNKEMTELLQCPAKKTSCNIPEGIVIIKKKAFERCELLTYISLPETLQQIEDNAFRYCYSLKSVVIPEHVNKIGCSAFEYCKDMENIVFSGNKITTIENSSFLNCSSLTSVTLPDSITVLSTRAFMDCYSLEEINIPEGVTWIGSQCFLGCRYITSMIIPDSATVLGGDIFKDCSRLKYIKMPLPQKYDTWGIIIDDNSLKDFSFMWSTIGDNSAIEEIELTNPHNVTITKSNFLEGCSKLTSITIPEGIEVINSFAFYGCTSLQEVHFPSTIRKINKSAFANCTSLTELTVPSTVTEIGPYAFTNIPHVTYTGTATDINNVSGTNTWGAKSIN